jgi:hypothetical protein
MGKKENKIQGMILDWLKLQLDIVCWRNNNGAVYDAKIKGYRKRGRHDMDGVPDILGYDRGDGTIIAIEVKFGKGKPTKEQSRFIEKVNESGGRAGVAYTLPDAIRIIRREE